MKHTTKQWNHWKSGGKVLALGVCAGAALSQPFVARSAGEERAEAPPRTAPAEQNFGGGRAGGPGEQNGRHQNEGGRDGSRRDGGRRDGGGHDGGGRMRPEQMMEQLNLTPAQQDAVQTIYEKEREQMHAIHEQTRTRVTELLNAEQKAQFAQMPMRGPHGKGPRGGPDRQNGNRPNGNGQNHDGRPPMRGGRQNEEPGEMRHEMRGGARHGMQGRDHGRPVESIARDLGVTPEQFRAAFERVRPAPRGQQPTEEQRQTNRKVLSQTLGVSPEKLDAVMDKYRPEGPPHKDQD